MNPDTDRLGWKAYREIIGEMLQQTDIRVCLVVVFGILLFWLVRGLLR